MPVKITGTEQREKEPTLARVASEKQDQEPSHREALGSDEKGPVERALDTLDKLDEIDLNNLRKEIVNTSKRRAQKTALQGVICAPMISMKEKRIAISSSLSTHSHSHFAFGVVACAALQLGFDVRTYEEEEVFRNLTEHEESFALGLAIMFTEPDSKISLGSLDKKKSYEEAKALFRSLQIVSIAGRLGLQKALKKNHALFCNNVTEKTMIGKQSVPVLPLKNKLSMLFEGSKHSREYSNMIETLIKLTVDSFSKEQQRELIQDHLIPKGDYIALYHSIVIPGQKKVKKREDKKKKVPGKPKQSSLLLSRENSAISSLFAPLFTEPLDSVKNNKAWVDILVERGTSYADEQISNNLHLRSEFLEKFSSMTTKRLKEVRKSCSLSVTKRKEDIKIDDLKSALIQRPNYFEAFAKELLGLLTDANKPLLGGKFTSTYMKLSEAEGPANVLVLISIGLDSIAFKEDPEISEIIKKSKALSDDSRKKRFTDGQRPESENSFKLDPSRNRYAGLAEPFETMRTSSFEERESEHYSKSHLDRESLIEIAEGILDREMSEGHIDGPSFRKELLDTAVSCGFDLDKLSEMESENFHPAELLNLFRSISEKISTKKYRQLYQTNLIEVPERQVKSSEFFKKILNGLYSVFNASKASKELSIAFSETFACLYLVGAKYSV